MTTNNRERLHRGHYLQTRPRWRGTIWRTPRTERATTFHSFMDLPVELQLLIWEFAAPRAILRIGNERDALLAASKYILRTLPPMAHACQMARDIVLNGSDHSFLRLFKLTDVRASRALERFYFSTRHETLWIPSDFLYHGLADHHFTLDLGPSLRHLSTERHCFYDIKQQFAEHV